MYLCKYYLTSRLLAYSECIILTITKESCPHLKHVVDAGTRGVGEVLSILVGESIRAVAHHHHHPAKGVRQPLLQPRRRTRSMLCGQQCVLVV